MHYEAADVDPANRAGIMGRTYRDALKPGRVTRGFAIGEVVESKVPGLAKGDVVEGSWDTNCGKRAVRA
ncbi:MAG: hypothetical protein JSR91_07770 [Proteobacteria bacterium]|nr:hypothetical protein [Pseudomonadota bacterium]